ncbi:N-acetylmuramoyl-L-alanine amidase, partial [Alkalibacterium pelagium]
LFEAVLNASSATAAWNAAQDFKEAYPNDSRLAEAMDSAAQRIFSMGQSSQNRERYPQARQYYNMLINESAVSNNLRTQASTKYAETIEAENKEKADDLYADVINASTATAAWNAAQDFKSAFPNDSRLPAAIDSAAQRILSMGTSNHRRGNFNTANTYYSQLLNEQNVSSSLRREVNELIQLSRQGIRLRTVNEYYIDSVNGATATDAWNIAVEGLKYNPGNARLVDALNMAAQRQFSMGQSQHRNGNYSSALTYYNRVFNHSSVRSDIRQVVGIFRTQAQQSRPLMTSVDYSSQSIRANTASAAWDIAVEGLIAYPHNSDIIDALNQAANRNLSLGRSQFRQGNFASARTYYNRVANEPAVSEAIRTLAGVFLQQLTPNYKHTVYIDAGHGGRDPGASFGGVRESDLNLSTALLLRTELQKLGYNVVMSRETDVFIEMSDRPFEANSISADIFVSIHYNSMGGAGTARGIESFIYHRVASGFGQETNRNNFRTEDPRIDESLRLADAMHANLISDTNMRDRGVKGNNFNVLRNSHIPAMLTELAFLDNAADRSIAVTREFQLSAARAMARGIDAYFSN